jgi:V8-like Glu-specific endopeptidase
VDKSGEQIYLQQYGLSRKHRIISIQPHKFKIGYAITTLSGHSGSPVVAEDNIIAIHIGGGGKS